MSRFGNAVLAITQPPAVRRLFTEFGLGWRLARRFVAGEALDEAIAVARERNARGMSVSLDHLGEHVRSSEAAEGAVVDYLSCLDRIGSEGLDANISVKLTQLGLGIDDDLCAKHLERLAERAATIGTTVSIDMEDSSHTEATLTLYREAQVKHGNLGVAVQAYLHRTHDDLASLMELGGHVRLCKGAYREPPEIAYQSRGAVSSSFRELLARLMRFEATKPAVATHDEELIAHTLALAASRAAPFEVQMLFGVRPERQQELVAGGIPVRVYIPYGTEWYPYLTRRLAERPANLLFFVRALRGG